MKIIKLTDEEIFDLMVAVEYRIQVCNQAIEEAEKTSNAKELEEYWTRELHKQNELSAKLMSAYIGK